MRGKDLEWKRDVNAALSHHASGLYDLERSIGRLEMRFKCQDLAQDLAQERRSQLERLRGAGFTEKQAQKALEALYGPASGEG